MLIPPGLTLGSAGFLLKMPPDFPPTRVRARRPHLDTYLGCAITPGFAAVYVLAPPISFHVSLSLPKTLVSCALRFVSGVPESVPCLHVFSPKSGILSLLAQIFQTTTSTSSRNPRTLTSARAQHGRYVAHPWLSVFVCGFSLSATMLRSGTTFLSPP